MFRRNTKGLRFYRLPTGSSTSRNMLCLGKQNFCEGLQRLTFQGPDVRTSFGRSYRCSKQKLYGSVIFARKRGFTRQKNPNHAKSFLRFFFLSPFSAPNWILALVKTFHIIRIKRLKNQILPIYRPLLGERSSSSVDAAPAPSPQKTTITARKNAVLSFANRLFRHVSQSCPRLNRR